MTYQCVSIEFTIQLNIFSGFNDSVGLFHEFEWYNSSGSELNYLKNFILYFPLQFQVKRNHWIKCKYLVLIQDFGELGDGDEDPFIVELTRYVWFL